jgi:hypothetical protein
VATRSGCVLAPELVHWRLVAVWKCAMLPFITADHFRMLLDGTGKPFAPYQFHSFHSFCFDQEFFVGP